jgi:uncharacterized delta-60 repeat protein
MADHFEHFWIRAVNCIMKLGSVNAVTGLSIFKPEETMIINRITLSFYILLLALTMSGTASAQTCPSSAGCLDPTFGTGGKVILAVHNSIPTAPEGMALQSDGKVVAVVGAFSGGEHLVRLNTDGSLDTTFGDQGVTHFVWSLTVGTSSYYGNAYALALQDVGGEQRIVVAGSGHLQSGRKVIGNVLRVSRFLSNGSLDPSFGTNGNSVINAGYALAMALQPDGKILTVGDVGQVVRLNSNGTLDTTFGSGGIVNSGNARAIVVDSVGRVMVGGSATVGKGNASRSVMAVKRYSPSGLPDTAFGTSGTATADFGIGGAGLWNISIDIAGNIVASGSTGGNAFALARFTPVGLVDTSFGGTGRVSLSGYTGNGRGLLIQADGKIVITGSLNNDFGLARYDSSGFLDTSFGNGGVVTTDVYGADYTYGSLLQTDGYILMTGGAAPYTTFARYVP